MKADSSFWHEVAHLAASSSIVIDRPKGSAHPRYPEVIYPLDYGYIENTRANDGSGIDAWLGTHSKEDKTLTGILCTFDTLKGDAEIKLLIGCTDDDVRIIRDFHSDMYTLYISNPMLGTI